MTVSGLIFLLLGFGIAALVSAHRLIGSKCLPFLIFTYHTGFALLYWWYSLHNVADARGYFFVTYSSNVNFDVGTGFIHWLVFMIQKVFMGSYLDLFLLFHIFGFVGIVFLYRSIIENFRESITRPLKIKLSFLFFLPGLHFWSSAIGKDSLIFMGICMVIWSLLSLWRRLIFFILGIVLVFLIRPHVGGVILVSVGMAILLGHNTPTKWKIIGLPIVLAIYFLLFPIVMNYIGLQDFTLKSAEEYVQKRQGFNLEGGSSVDIRNYPFLIKFFTYLFRPLFFDSNGLFGIIVSVENAIWLLLSSILLKRCLRLFFKVHLIDFFIRFNLLFFFLQTIIFCLMTSNLGIAVRQKTMVLPSLAICILTVYVEKLILRFSKTKQKNVCQLKANSKKISDYHLCSARISKRSGIGGVIKDSSSKS